MNKGKGTDNTMNKRKETKGQTILVEHNQDIQDPKAILIEQKRVPIKCETKQKRNEINENETKSTKTVVPLIENSDG